jgi:hypothetical protein
MVSEVTAGDALVQIAEVEPSALKLVGDLMDFNERMTSALLNGLLEGEMRAHEETRERLRAAQRRLALIEDRVLWLLGHDVLD